MMGWLLGRQDVRPWCQTIPAPSHVPILKIIVGIIERREVRGNHKAAIAVMYLIRALYDIRRQKYLLAGDCRRAPKCVLTHIGKGHFPQEQICQISSCVRAQQSKMGLKGSHAARLRREQERRRILRQLDHHPRSIPEILRSRVALLLRRPFHTYSCRTFWKSILNLRFHDRYLAAHKRREVLGMLNGLRARGL